MRPETLILDIGAGFGGAARYLAENYGCSVTCLNLSEVENERNREMNAARGLTGSIDVVDGSFETSPSRTTLRRGLVPGRDPAQR